VLRAYAGVRPLLSGGRAAGGDGRDISRGFFVLDHAARDEAPAW
jgi:glycerol-3-phosphate dehydrogenase